jgi:surface protein
MTGALPTTDTTGKVRLTKGEYFDFTIKSSIKGNTNINWEIAAEDITPSSAKKMAGKNIKLYLTKLDSAGAEEEVMAPKVYSASTSANTKTGRPSGVMSLATGTMSTSDTTNYRLRMYVDEDYNPQGDGGGLSFSVKINAYGKVKEAPTGSKMKVYATQADFNEGNFIPPQTDFHTAAYMSKITSIITKKDNIVPETATESWDISEAGDGSVMAYVEDDGTGNDTYKVTIGGKGGIIANESMVGYFVGFNKMTSIDLSVLDTSEVTDMSDMFEDCSSLTSLDVSKFDTSNVTNMSDIFSTCSSLTSLDVSNFDTSNVINMNGMFVNCSSLTSLDVRNFDTSKVTDMSYMFYYCSSLTSLDVSSFDTSQVTDMSNMFCSCEGLTSLDLRNFDTSKVTDMGQMFQGCTSLTSLDVRNFDTSKVTDMGAMFWDCEGLTSLDLRNFDTSQVTNMITMFSDCYNLTSLDVSSFDTSQVTDMKYMFDSCSSLTSLDVSSFDTSKVTNMSQMFDSCSSLTSLDLRNFDTSKLTDMSRMFIQCGKLTQITVSNKWVIKSGASTYKMFDNCGTDHVTVV